MKLTKLQIEIIEHRLEVPDAIFDACESAIDAISPVVTYQQFDAAVIHVAEMIKSEFETADFTNVEWLIFEDAIEGSTMPDLADDEVGLQDMSHQRAAAIRKVHDDLYARFVGKGGTQ